MYEYLTFIHLPWVTLTPILVILRFVFKLGSGTGQTVGRTDEQDP